MATGINASTDGTLKIENVNITGFSMDALAFASTGGTGSLAVSGSLTADKPIAVRSGKLIGTGVVQGAIVDAAASVIPGPLPGVLQVDALALASGSTTSFEIDGPLVGDQYTQLKTPGVLDLTGVNLSLHFGAGYIPDDGASFTLVKGGTISGQFVGLPEKALIPVGSKFANISYVGGTGNDVVLSMQFQPIFTGLSDQSRVYGTASTEFTGTISAGADIPVGQTVKITLNGVSHDVTIASDGGFASTFDISGLTPGGSPYTVSYAYAGQGAFRSAEGSSKLSIGSKSLTITALPASKTYGDTLTFTGTEFTVTGLNDGDFVSSVTLVSAGTAPDARVPNSPYVIEASNAVGSGLEKYVITYQNGRLSVNAKALTISAGSTSKTYGDTVNFSGNEYTTSGLINGDTVESVTLNSAGAQANARVDGSPYRIIPSGVSGNGLDNYHINYVDGNLTVGRKSLSITASPRSKTYGSAAVFNGTEFTTSGLINGDLVRGATLQSDGAPVGATVAGSPYAIVPSAAFGSGLNNYEITYVNGNLSVGAKPLSIKAESTSKTYGGTVNFAGTEFTSSGLVNGDQVSRVVLRSEGAAAAAPVAGSPYAVVPGDASGTGLGNYAITYLNGSLTVGTKALTILAGSIGKVYGDTVVFAGTEFLSDGLVNNDSITSVTLRSAGAAATASAFGSPYAITASEAVGTGLSNYAITYANGQLAVARRALFVQANSFSKTYGGTIGFQGTEFTTSGLVNGDKVSRVVLSSPGQTYNASVADSPYPVIPKNAYGTGLTNYAIEYLNGGLAVNPKALTITARSTTKTYGTTVNLVGTEFTSSGLIYGDTVTKVTLTSNGTAPNAGVQGTPYAINASEAVGKGIGNYAINYVPGRLNVLAKALTITANNQTIPFGSNPKPFTATYAGFANGETAADLATPPQFRTAAGPKSPAGRYTLYVSGATSPNYTIRFVNGVVTVLPYVQPADFAQRSATAFITTLYVEVLGREPGTDGLNYWVPKVLAGQSKASIFQLFSTSPERKALEKAGTAPTIPLNVAYADALKAAQNPPPAVPAGPLALLASRRGR